MLVVDLSLNPAIETLSLASRRLRFQRIAQLHPLQKQVWVLQLHCDSTAPLLLPLLPFNSSNPVAASPSPLHCLHTHCFHTQHHQKKEARTKNRWPGMRASLTGADAADRQQTSSPYFPDYLPVPFPQLPLPAVRHGPHARIKKIPFSLRTGNGSRKRLEMSVQHACIDDDRRHAFGPRVRKDRRACSIDVDCHQANLTFSCATAYIPVT